MTFFYFPNKTNKKGKFFYRFLLSILFVCVYDLKNFVTITEKQKTLYYKKQLNIFIQAKFYFKAFRHFLIFDTFFFQSSSAAPFCINFQV